MVIATDADVDVEGIEPAIRTVEQLYRDVVSSLPLVGIAVVVLILGIAVALLATHLARRALGRVTHDPVVLDFTVRILRITAIVAVALLALSIAGVRVGPALAGLGLAGLALAFAVQSILENFIAGLVLLVRRPFRSGDQIRTNDFEGTVLNMDLRVTRLIDYNGELILIPNVDVYTKSVVNLTRRGKRRTVVTIGIDYRDDHDAAREVIRDAVAAVDGVLDDPPVEVLLCELGESSVDFEIRYWTLPDIRSVAYTRDRVLSAAKTGIAEAGMTIPWPIRTLVFDNPVEMTGEAVADGILRDGAHDGRRVD